MDLSWLNGLVDLPWWGYIVVALVFTHITIAAVTIYLHRHQAHRALDLGPIPSHFFRFWLWLTTGMVTKQWAAIHRKHHAKCETEEDPHSPVVKGIKKVFFEGAELYRAESKVTETMDKYGHGTPDDWLERNIYSAHSAKGPTLMMIINLMLFGPNGIWIWAVQMIWIPLFAAGVINGIGHYWGYRNFECEDASTNVLPWGIIIGGEELHNNHHTFGTSAKLSYKWFEFDIGWMYIRIMEMLGMAKVRKVAPKMKTAGVRPELDEHALAAIVANRYSVAANYAKSLKQTVADEVDKLRANTHLPQFDFNLARQMKVWLKQDAKDTPAAQRPQLDAVLAQSNVLNQVYQMRQELTRLWERSSLSRAELLKHLQDWCARAEASGIAALQEFSLRLRSVAAV
ncbi:stearoyl-CoA desaturase (delta-9 desaturase) [Andreprevotia lacus DSM 23236]|jgi:stearoyl-CoA desaturase (delta-9 desaturase)|uniref:Stearoyl-CoA desaturase (Delta-9 desaturase) n=1 Tax=Andreprevotia lacus DSM 23236 TaxID=1121001 RepID=A0A1W1XY19_9NEIS|nr:fatty acid desaturase [Andreprevotia lacus]SMC28816.1 stearoyl-CoA desaturase (delta-9 desaturase) [Andreprevotia lacus DSM 23236]